MDIPRPKTRSKKRWIYGSLALAAVLLMTVALSKLEPAAPSVDLSTIWMDTVQRGTMVREVSGPGTLVPEQIRFISAVTAGRVERVLLEPGVTVDSSTVLLVLSNPDVQLQQMEAQRQLAGAEAELASLEALLENQRLNQEAVVATVQADYNEAVRQMNINKELADRGLISQLDLQNAVGRATELATRLKIEQQRLNFIAQSTQAQLSAQRSNIERLRGLAAFQQRYVESMQVTAGTEGVLRELSLQEGQWVNPGDRLAVVVQPGRLKAEVRIPETQARDVAIGQSASIDTRNGIIQGSVTRIDPAVENGTVTVDIALEGPLPRGARPDLSVDATIEIERLENVLYVGRPAYGQAESTVGLFKLVDGGGSAVRTQVRLGRSSVNTIEVEGGLQEGDVVILSDMSAYDTADRVKLQ